MPCVTRYQFVALLSSLLGFANVSAETPPVFDETGRVLIRDTAYEIYPADLLRSKGIAYPDVPDDQNAAWVHLQAINAMKPLPSELQDAFQAASSGTWPEDETADRLSAWIDENREAMALARQAASMPQYHMPLFRGESDAVFATLLPSLGHTRQLARLLTADAAAQLQKGNPEAAMESLLTAQRMGNQVSHGNTLIEGLVGLAVCNLANQSMMRLADSGAVDAATLRAAAQEMEQNADHFPEFEQMVRAEQNWAGGFIEDIFEMPGGVRMAASLLSTFPERKEPSAWDRLQTALSRVYLPDRAIKRHFNDHYDALIKSTRTEDGSVGEMIEEEKLFARIPAWDSLVRSLVPSLSRAYELTLQAKSNQVRTRVRLAVEAYRAEKGAYPPTLSAMVPGYLSEVPVDPMTGYEFDYAPAGLDGRPQGLAQLTNESAEELRKKRRTPAILSPRASKWRRYVAHFSTRHRLNDAQRSAAESVLRDIEARAAAFERAQGQTLQALIDEGNAAEAEARMGPLTELFKELQNRLNTIPSAEQRKASDAAASVGP